MQPSSFQSRSTLSHGGMGSSYTAAASSSEIPTHRPSGEPIPISEQLMQVDQAITHTLQEIDANFAKSHQIITGKILPSIRRYGVASHNTWQGARFWHRFFETASDINLVPSNGEEGMTTLDDERSSTSFASPNREASTSSTPPRHERRGDAFDRDGNVDISGIDDSGEFKEQDFEQPSQPNQTTSLAPEFRDEKERHGKAAKWAQLELPIEKLRRDVESDFSFSQDGSPSSAVDGYNGTGGMRSKFENSHPDRAGQLRKVTPKRAVGGSRLGTQVLRSQHEQQTKNSARKVQATPKRGTSNQGNPFTNGKGAQSVRKENVQRWNGIADLRKTPLAKIKAESKKGKGTAIDYDDQDESNDSLAWPEGMSPPVTMRMAIPQRRYSKTPAKEAARLVVDDVLRMVEGASPATRRKILQGQDLYGIENSRPGMGGLVSTPLKRGIQKGRKSLPTPPTVTKRLGRGVAQTINDSPAGTSSSKLLDEDEGGDQIGNVNEDEEEEDDEVDPDLGTGLSKLALTQSSASIDKLLEVNGDDDDDSSGEEEESDTDSEEDDNNGVHVTSSRITTTLQSKRGNANSDYPTGSSIVSNSRSIDQDTLFGIRAPQSSSKSIGSGTGPGPSALRTASNLSSSSVAPDQSSLTHSNSHKPYQPMGAQLGDHGTVYSGRPLLGDDRDDTYSAPSPTPATALGRRSK